MSLQLFGTIALLFATCILRAQSLPRFMAIDTGILPGYTISQATAVSSTGIVAGYSSNSPFLFNNSGSSSSQGWMYANGVLTSIPKNNQSATVPLGVNASGQVVGIMGPAGASVPFTPFWYKNGAFNTPGNFPRTAIPVAISDVGPAIALTDAVPGSLFTQAAVWTSNETFLPKPSVCSEPKTNCYGQVAGISLDGTHVAGVMDETASTGLQGYWPFVGNGQTINTYFSQATTLSFATSVNNSGQGVGWTGTAANGKSATLFNRDGTFSSLGGGFPLSINNSGWIVGAVSVNSGFVMPPFSGDPVSVISPVLHSVSPGTAAAVLWINGTAYQLNSCSCVMNGSGWDFEYAYAINDANQIVGTGFHNGVQTGFLLTPQPAGPVVSSVISASSFGGSSSVAPGTWVEIYGSNLAADTRQWASSDFDGNNAPTSLDDVQVTIGGQKAFIDYISSAPGQVNAQLPSNIPTGGQLPVVLTNRNGTSQAFNVMVNATQPGLLAPASFVIDGKQYIVALLSDGVTYVLPTGAIPGVTSRPAQPGETITLYGIGFGSVTPETPAGQLVTQLNQLSEALQIVFDQSPAQVSYAGLAPGFLGLYQFNIAVPPLPDNDLVPMSFNLGGVRSTQTLYIAVHQ